MCVYVHAHILTNVSVDLQIDTDSLLGEKVFPVFHSLSVNSGADTPGEQLAKL